MNLADHLTHHDGDRIALHGRTGTTTYRDLADQAARLRGGLAGRGVEAGDRVAIVAANNELFVVAFYAVVGLGAVAVPLNPSAPAPELERELRSAEIVGLVAGPTGAATLGGVDAGLLAALRVVGVPDAMASEETTSLSDLATADPHPVVDTGAEAPAVVLFTSGTAGPPRGAVLTHGNLEANQVQMLAGDPEAVVPDDVGLAVVPLFHVLGLNVVLGLAMRVGASLLLEERFDVARTLERCREYGVTVVAAAPPLWLAWSELDEPHPALTGLRRARSGAAALPIPVVEALHDTQGIWVSEGYGLTEAAPAVTIPPEDDVRVGSIGRPLPGVEVRLVDDDGHDALVGDPGEVWVRGANVFAGYLDGGDSPVDSAGWLHTGDIAVTDDDGWLYLVDRIKDLIIVSGFNVFPSEVEDVLVDHPSVAAAVVVGEPDDNSGERVVAHVVPTTPDLFEEDAVLSFVATRLPRFKCPARIDVHDFLPASAVGKTPRRLLRDGG